MLRKRSGQAIIEFTLAFFVFFYLMMGIIQIFLLVQNKTALEAAGNYAMRVAASVDISAPGQCSVAESLAYDALLEALAEIGNGSVGEASLRVDCSHPPLPLANLYMYPMTLEVDLPMKLIMPFFRATISLKADFHGSSEHLKRSDD